MKLNLTTLTMLILSIPATFAQTVVLWNFNGNNTIPTIGTGNVTTIGGVTNSGYNSGNGSSDTSSPNFGYQTTTYPAQSTNSGTAGVRFDTSTVGFTMLSYTGVQISFDLRLSNTSSRWYQVDYTVDGGTNWTLGTPVRLGLNPNSGDTWFNNNTVVINDTATLNNPNFGFRVVSVFSPLAFTEANSTTSYLPNTAYEVARNTDRNYGGNGTWRFDMVTVTAIPEPATWLLLGAGLTALLVLRRRHQA